MAERLDVKPGQVVEVVNASAPKGKPKPTFLAGERLTVFFVTADQTALSVRGHQGLWRAERFKLPA